MRNSDTAKVYARWAVKTCVVTYGVGVIKAKLAVLYGMQLVMIINFSFRCVDLLGKSFVSYAYLCSN